MDAITEAISLPLVGGLAPGFPSGSLAHRVQGRRCGAGLGERGCHHVRGLAGRGQGLNHLGYTAVWVVTGVVHELAILVLDYQESSQLLVQLGQALADELEAAHDVADVAWVAKFAAAPVRQLVQHADRVRRLARDLAWRHGARKLGHWPSSASHAHSGTTCSSIRLLGELASRLPGTHRIGGPVGTLIYTIRPRWGPR